jgi:hypothetical protein
MKLHGGTNLKSTPFALRVSSGNRHIPMNQPATRRVWRSKLNNDQEQTANRSGKPMNISVRAIKNDSNCYS